jgi:hypothetical protein
LDIGWRSRASAPANRFPGVDWGKIGKTGFEREIASGRIAGSRVELVGFLTFASRRINDVKANCAMGCEDALGANYAREGFTGLLPECQQIATCGRYGGGVSKQLKQETEGAASETAQQHQTTKESITT